MSRTMRFLFPILLLLIIMSSSTLSQVPRELNYQGLLTDDVGSPVPDDVYNITFRLYDAETAGTTLWMEEHPSVQVNGGLFVVILGQTTPIPESTFVGNDVYLSIQVAADPELTPRTKLTASAYAIHAQYADSVTGGSYVRRSGDTLTGDLYFDYGGNGDVQGCIDLGYTVAGGEYTDVTLYGGGTLTTKIWGDVYGEIGLYHSDNNNLRADLAATPNGGSLSLRDESQTEHIKLDAGASGNSSVVFPENAVDAVEMLNEPGIAYAINANAVLLNSSTVMEDLASLTITIPDDGFIYLCGRCYIRLKVHDSANYNGAVIQIDETEGGGTNAYATIVTDVSNYSNTARLSAFTDRLCWKEQGTYTFRLEGREYDPSGYQIDAFQSAITAMYFPTSYGEATALVSDPGENPEAYPVSTTDGDLPVSETVYEADLRWYELRAREAKQREAEASLRAAEAELEYLRAKEAAKQQTE